jgi:hypothetical protein
LNTAAKSTFPIWPTYLLGASAAIALYLCFATIFSWWPTARSLTGRSKDAAQLAAADHVAGHAQPADTDSDADIQVLDATSTAEEAAALPSPPVDIRLKPELDMATNRFRLGVLNRGELGRFRAEVVDAHNQDGNFVGPRSWPVPWLNGGDVDAKEIPKFGKPLLDFAHFDFLGSKRTWKGPSG